MHKYKETRHTYMHTFMYTQTQLYIHILTCAYIKLFYWLFCFGILIMHPWCYTFSIYSGNKDHFEGTYHLHFNIFGIKLEWHFYKNIPPNLIFSHFYSHRINKLCASVCVLVPTNNPPPEQCHRHFSVAHQLKVFESVLSELSPPGSGEFGVCNLSTM